MQPLPTILVIGEILLDVFPTYTRLGGAPFNFAFHLSRCGLPVHFVSRIGDDANGRQIIETLHGRNFDTTYIQQDKAHATGTVRVELQEGGIPRFDIAADVAYDYIEFDSPQYQKLIDRARLIYFGTLVQRSFRGFGSVQQFLNHRRSDGICFYDINLRPGGYSEEVVRASLAQADIVKLNTDEREVCRQMAGREKNKADIIAYFMQTYHLRSVALTDGERGSILYAGKERHVATPALVNHLEDTVGAGDGFAALLAAGFLLKWPPAVTLRRATEFASRICEIKGAISESDDFYSPWRALVAQGVPYGT
jgi:fructokinase